MPGSRARAAALFVLAKWLPGFDKTKMPIPVRCSVMIQAATSSGLVASSVLAGEMAHS
jgi:hypothetical protein